VVVSSSPSESVVSLSVSDNKVGTDSRSMLLQGEAQGVEASDELLLGAWLSVSSMDMDPSISSSNVLRLEDDFDR
jgi:hypothetical protein